MTRSLHREASTSNWTTKDGYPVGVVVAYVYRDDKFWTTCAERRKRVPALRTLFDVLLACRVSGEPPSLLVRSELIDDLVLGPDKHEWCIEYLLNRWQMFFRHNCVEKRPVGFGGAFPIGGDLYFLHEGAETNVLPSMRSESLDSFVHARGGPSGFVCVAIWQRPPEPGELKHIALACGQNDQRPSVATDKHWDRGAGGCWPFENSVVEMHQTLFNSHSLSGEEATNG